LTNKINPNCRL